MRERRQTATSGTPAAGRVGAVGVLTAGALCAAVLSIAGRMPPDPVDQGGIPEIVIGSAQGSDAQPAVRPEGRVERQRRVGTHSSDARGKRAARRLAARRRQADPGAEARGRAGDDVGRGDRGGAKPRGGEAPAAPGPDGGSRGGGRGGPKRGSPPGGQGGGLVLPTAAAQPVQDEDEQPEPGPSAGADDDADDAAPSAASAPEDEPSDDPEPSGRTRAGPESDSDEPETDTPDP